jgi:cytosine/adenosine deaminase-related metal-dependent hydrolase
MISLPLAIVNARVWTNDARRPWADAVLVRGERIVAVGSSAEMRKRAGRAVRIVDARGRLVLPSRPEGAIAAGAVANLVIVEGEAPGEPPLAADASAVLFRLVEGRIEVDRDALAP